MKTLNKILMGIFLFTGLLSCEMKEEMLGKENLLEETGILTLGVATNDETNVVTTKADSGDETINQFPVTIYDSKGEVYKQYNSYSEVENDLKMPIGDYKVKATSPEIEEFNNKNTMDKPFFEGEEPFTIIANTTNKVTVECHMKNLPISIEPDGNFINTFSSWTITLDDGKNSTATFSNAKQPPYTTYWKVGENVREITVNIQGTTTNGDKVTQKYTCTKSGAEEDHVGDSEYFVGGDKLVIKLSPETADIEVGVKIGINVELSFANSDETTEIPVEIEDGGNPTDPDPEEPQDTPTIEYIIDGVDYFKEGISYSIEANNAPTTSTIQIKTPSGISQLIVSITAGNNGFAEVMDEMELNTNADLIERKQELDKIFANTGLNITCPEKGETDYTFPIGLFYGLMNIYGPTVDADEEDEPDGKEFHTFYMKVIDLKGLTEEKTLKVTISK